MAVVWNKEWIRMIRALHDGKTLSWRASPEAGECYTADTKFVLELAQKYCPLRLHEGLHEFTLPISKALHDFPDKVEESQDGLSAFIILAALLTERDLMRNHPKISCGENSPGAVFACSLPADHQSPEHVASYPCDHSEPLAKRHICVRWPRD